MPENRIDPLTPEQRRRTMANVKGKDTKPEIAVRSLLHRLGYRFRLHRSDLPGKPDIVLPKYKSVVFVHGCFWHGHDCKAGRKRPKTNSVYWDKKLTRNRKRDHRNQQALQALGWCVIIVWECELRDLVAVGRDLSRLLQLSSVPINS